ncbi:LmeA family phospholipid-binding protein [Myxosarcina sp. GI1(2024)]
MEIFTIALLGLLGTLSSGGLIVDFLVDKNLRSQIVSVEERAIRIDNLPNYQIAGGKLQKVRLAARGVELEPIRIEVLELETDGIALKRSKLNSLKTAVEDSSESSSLDSTSEFREALGQPLQGAFKIVLTESDLNRALSSPQFQQRLQKTLNRLVAHKGGSSNLAYELLAPSLEFSSPNHLQINFTLRRSSNTYRSRDLAMAIELRVTSDGRQIYLSELKGTVNRRPMSSRLLRGFADGISDRLNLEVFEADGILARLLQLEIDENNLKLTGFARVETK